MALKECTRFFGRRRLIRTPPSLRIARDVVFVPFIGGGPGGLFEQSGRAVPESIAYSGSPKLHTAQSTISIENMPPAPALENGEHCYYIGEINPHYGHFLVGALARLWALPQKVHRDCRLVFSSTMPIDGLMQLDFFRGILTALGLSAANLLRIVEPVRFDQIIVPASTFEELSLIHQDFVSLMGRIGEAIAGSTSVVGTRRLVYLSKEKLDRGVIRVSNEDLLTANLRNLGVDVVFPERLPFSAQVALWAEDAVMMGFSGSVFHTSAFLPSRTVMILAHSEEMWCNQILIDMANRNFARYLYEDAGLIRHEATAMFNATFEIRDPTGLAADIVRWGRRMQPRPRFGAPGSS